MNNLKISVAVLSYNAESRISECLQNIKNQIRQADEILVIDNNSSDRTVEIVKNQHADVHVWVNSYNSGCAGGRNRQIEKAMHDHIMIVDDDAFLEENCLSQLENAIVSDPHAGIWAPRICYDSDKKKIQFDGGGKLHFICEAILKHPDMLIDNANARSINNHDSEMAKDNNLLSSSSGGDYEALDFQGGVAFLVNRLAATTIDGYDESYFFGRTDGEFSIRLAMAGYRILNVKDAIVYHRVKPRGFAQVERQIRNRWSLMLVTYSISTILLLIPAFLVYELSLMAFMVLKKQLQSYLKANIRVLRDIPQILKSRRNFIRHKKVRDCEYLSAGRINIRKDITSSFVMKGLRLLDVFFKYYWVGTKRLLSFIQ